MPRISELPDATSLTGDEYAIVVQSSTTKKTPVNTLQVLKSYFKASLPVATTGVLIYVSDATGGAVPAFSDGSIWRRVTDRTQIN